MRSIPDFFIVGAAKAGTTSLYRYLDQHPAIFFPKIKEPKYFVSTFLNLPQNGNGDEVTDELMIKNWDEYKDLYSKKLPQQISGDASVDYLYYSEQVIPQLKKLIGNPKIIIILRHPTKRSISAYKHMVRDVREHLSFEDALNQETIRIEKNFEFIWHYKKASLYYDDVLNYTNSFTKVKVILFEDFISRPRPILKEVYRFLNIDDSFSPTIEKAHNFTGKPRNKWLQQLLKGSPNNNLRRFMKSVFGERTRIKLREFLENKNISKDQIEIDQKTILELNNYFKKDAEKTLNLLNINKDFWF